MQCKNCFLWTEYNKETHIGICFNPNFQERGPKTRYLTHAKTLCRFGVTTRQELHLLNKHVFAPHCTR